MVDFSKFDKAVDIKALKEQMAAAPVSDNAEVPAGEYIVTPERMEIKETKNGDKLMLSAGVKIVENLTGKGFIGAWVWFNRVIRGNKTTEKWNDGVAINGVRGWLDKFEAGDPVEFTGCGQLSKDVDEIFASIKGATEIKVKYDSNEFYPIKILEVYDL